MVQPDYGINQMNSFELNTLLAQRAAAGKLYLEFLREASLSAGLYILPAGGVDPQQPHMEDEVYYVISGRGSITVANEVQPVEAGSIVFVPAEAEHRFHGIAEELVILVFFAPPESNS
jgi:mannose-6-phosphate isomerase-like protein (cupin superfamily)